jgi:SAM-dependent methyltransferase
MSTEFLRETSAAALDVGRLAQPRADFLDAIIQGLKRRWLRERRRRKVGRAYDMAAEIARVIPRGSEVLDVGCGNGFIAHHLSAMLGTRVIGLDVMDTTQAPIDYRQFDGEHFPLADNSVDAVLLCYVLHHAQDVARLFDEMKRVLRLGGVAIIYEDIPETLWDKVICWTHDLQWRKRTGACTFRSEAEWSALFEEFGFEVSIERQLSRARNFMHPVRRRFYLLRAEAKQFSVPPARPVDLSSRLSVLCDT